MKKTVLVVTLLAGLAPPPAWAAGAKERCYSPAAIEAEQAIRFMTDLMVVSSTCRDTIYAQFRLRNQTPILAYQKAMIAHFRSTTAFDSWNTSVANAAARKQAGLPSVQVCQQAAELLKKASALDPSAFRQYAAARAATVGATYPKCGKRR